MKMINKLGLGLLFSLFSFVSQADDPVAENTEQASFKLPPIMFYSTLEDSLFEALKKQPIFTELDKELYGSPLRVTVTHTFAPTASGAATGLTSAVLAGGSLGLLPLVTNNDLIITYRFGAHGRVLATFSYSKNFTQATNMYSDKGINYLDKPSMEWALTTVDEFVQAVASNEELRALTEEYNYYFGMGAN